jgi:glyceraldehyde-3-phosphate dehydrogenase (NADP+)
MNATKHLKGLFPVSADIPESVRLKEPVHQRQVLIDGELIEWNGPTHMVFSPVFIRGDHDEDEKQFAIGSYPLGTVLEADRALEAAAKAYDAGRGVWPAMPLQQRIECLEDFTYQMSARKADHCKTIDLGNRQKFSRCREGI